MNGVDSARTVSNFDRPQGHQQTGRDGNQSTVIQPKPQALPTRQGPSAILVSTRQKGNPILNHIKSLPWEYSDIPCDYVLGATTCALFLSLKYHRLHPDYIYHRLRALGKLYNLRILLTMVDIENHEQALQELSKTSMINNLTLILAWSAQEAGRYIELFKSYEHASPSSIRARQAESWQESLTEFVTTPRNINKTDAASLISNFGTLRAAVNAAPEELALIPGWGEKKVRSWHDSVREPFRVKRTAKANAHLFRQESSMISDGDGSATPDQPGLDPIAVGSLPANVSRENTPSDLADTARPQSSHKRPRLQEILPEDEFDDDDDMDALLAVDQVEKVTTKPSLAEEQKSKPAGLRQDPQLSSGVAAALAKYRTNT